MLKGLVSFPKEEITLVASLDILKVCVVKLSCFVVVLSFSFGLHSLIGR